MKFNSFNLFTHSDDVWICPARVAQTLDPSFIPHISSGQRGVDGTSKSRGTWGKYQGGEGREGIERGERERGDDGLSRMEGGRGALKMMVATAMGENIRIFS